MSIKSRAATTTARQLCKQLRAERRAQEVTQTQVARRIGTEQANVSLWETCKQLPNLLSFVAYADAIGFTIRLERKDQQ